MQQQVVMSTQQHSNIYIGSPLVTQPLVNVMCLAPRGWAFAPRPTAPAVTSGQGDSLASGEQSL